MFSVWLKLPLLIYSILLAWAIADIRIAQYAIERLRYLRSIVNTSVLVHMHIPKAGGTALALALSSNCDCKVIPLSKDAEPKPSCLKCQTVHSPSSFESIYTINRATGWKCGVHPPLAAMQYCLEVTDSPSNLRRKGFTPIYIIMLREPFSRFVSESLKWTDLRGHAVDWYQHITVDKGKKPSANKTMPLHGDILLQYAKQNDGHFIFPNRQVKMIGGKLENFDMRFQSRHSQPRVGIDGASRWKQTTPSSTQESLQNAKSLLPKQMNVIFGLQERFEEFLCMLELIYGELYRFNWFPTIHSHNHTALTTVLSSAAYERNHSHRSLHDNLEVSSEYENYRRFEPLMKTWASHNQADLELYAFAQEVFQLQFHTILHDVDDGVKSAVNINAAPHCRSFLIRHP